MGKKTAICTLTKSHFSDTIAYLGDFWLLNSSLKLRCMVPEADSYAFYKLTLWCSRYCLLFIFLAVLGIKPRTMLGEHGTTELHPQLLWYFPF
jgi:hypothetical protein